jgi:hypothetical protein
MKKSMRVWLNKPGRASKLLTMCGLGVDQETSPHATPTRSDFMPTANECIKLLKASAKDQDASSQSSSPV